ncbi:MAG: manganese catalase family protein [Oscillospiraceae bacterium]|jgi:spore coat protein JC|nr:manganese catalase family protein [Oscillospiraceae bacterium]
MFLYQKMLQFPVQVESTNPALAQLILEQFGGADGELAASMRYLTQRYYMPLPEAKALLTDIGTEELNHWEMIATIVWKLVEHAPIEKIKASPYVAHFVDHGRNPFPHNAAGVPFTATYFNAKSDPVADLHENMAAEQKARATYEHLLQVSNDHGVNQTLSFLREREVVHFQRFGEMLDRVQDYMYSKRRCY